MKRRVKMIKASEVKKLREITGAGMMDCKKALEEAKGVMDEAIKLVKERGLAKAEKKADRLTNQGYVGSYVHSNGSIGALVELQCETDFVARNDEFKQLACEIAMQVAAMAPENEAELLKQEMIKNNEVTVEEAMKLLSGKIGEKIVLGRFMRMMIGE